MDLPLFILWAASEWDIALTVGLFIIGGTMSLTAWFFKGRLSAYDKHLEECRERAITQGRMDERLHNVEKRLDGISTSVRWLGDCTVAIGARLDIKDLPSRPS